MKQISGKDLSRIVEQRGWRLLRVTGSHHIFGKEGSVIRLSIPVHRNQPLKLGLLRALMKHAGLSESDL